MRKNWIAVLSVPFILFLMVGAAWSATTSGVDSFKIYIDTNQTTLGGDAVNMAINVLNASGAVNTTSNGLSGDVLFEVTSQLGVTSWNDGDASGLINTAGDGAGAPNVTFAADVDQYIQPVGGVIFGSIAYAGVSGTDTIVVNMYEAQMSGGAVGPANVVPGNLLKTETFNVTVGQGNATVNRLAVICGNVGANLGPDPNLAANNDMTQDATIPGSLTTLFGETIYDEGPDADADITQSNAGVDFGLHVRATNGANAVDQSRTGATVKVYFAKVTSLGNANAAGGADTTPSTKALIYTADNPDGVEELEVTLSDGVWDGVVQLRSSGNWLPVVYQDHDDGSRAINVQRASADAADNIVLHQVLPKGTIASITLSAGTSTVPQDNDALVDDEIERGFLVSLFDEYGNPTFDAAGVTVSFATTPDGSIPNLAIGANAVSGRTDDDDGGGDSLDLPNNIGNWTVTASISALSLTSESVNVKVVTTPMLNTTAGALFVDDDGVNSGTRTFIAGQEIHILLDNAFVVAQNLVGAVAYLGSYTDTIQKTEQAIYGGDADGSGVANDYVCSFPATSAGGNQSLWFGIQGDPVSPIYLKHGDTNSYVDQTGVAVIAAGTNAQDIDVNAAASASFVYYDYTSTEQTTYNLLYGQNFMLRGQRFHFQDSHGNNVVPTANINFLAGLTSADSNAFTLGAADLLDWAPGAGAVNNVGLNGGLTSAAAEENVQVQFNAAVADDTDTLNCTMSSTAGDSYAFTLLNIGNPFTQIQLSSNSGVTTTIEMPQNGVIPVLVETLDANNNRLPSDAANDLLIVISDANLAVANDSAAGAALVTGSTLGTAGLGGRAILRVTAGASTGQTTLKAQTTDGTIVSNTLTIDVKSQAPEQPTQGEAVDAGTGSTDPADVTPTEDDTLTLYVYTLFEDDFIPTDAWVTLCIPGTTFWWVYDEANTAFVRFDLTTEGVDEAMTNYPFTATGADQQIGTANLPLTGLSGITFQVTFFYKDADGNFQNFSYLITVG